MVEGGVKMVWRGGRSEGGGYFLLGVVVTEQEEEEEEETNNIGVVGGSRISVWCRDQRTFRKGVRGRYRTQPLPTTTTTRPLPFLPHHE